MPGLRVVSVMSFPRGVWLVKDYQQGDAREENEEGDQKVAVGDDAFGGLQEAHAAGLSRGGDAILVSGYVGGTVSSGWTECQTAAIAELVLLRPRQNFMGRFILRGRFPGAGCGIFLKVMAREWALPLFLRKVLRGRGLSADSEG